MASDSVLQYMIIVLGIIGVCIMFSSITKRIAYMCARGGAGLIFIGVCKGLFGGFGTTVGVNLANGIFIGILGLPALIGLYILDILF